MRSVFTFVIPMAFINYYPALYLLGKPDPTGMPAWLPFIAPLVALLVFAVAELPRDSGAEERAAFERGEGGALNPVVCVDKLAAEIQSFEALKTESREAISRWDILFVATLDGNSMDASLLLLNEVGFLQADDPRFAGTVAATDRVRSCTDAQIFQQV